MCYVHHDFLHHDFLHLDYANYKYDVVNCIVAHREKYHSTAKKSDYSVYFSFFKYYS